MGIFSRLSAVGGCAHRTVSHFETEFLDVMAEEMALCSILSQV